MILKFQGTEKEQNRVEDDIGDYLRGWGKNNKIEKQL